MCRNRVWLEAIGGVRSRHAGQGAILPHPTAAGIPGRNAHTLLHAMGIDRNVPELTFIKELM
eukprot:13512124-Alexandrium_andersonii.AAC.1